MNKPYACPTFKRWNLKCFLIITALIVMIGCKTQVRAEPKQPETETLEETAPKVTKVSYTPQKELQKIENSNYYFYQTSAKASVEVILPEAKEEEAEYSLYPGDVVVIDQRPPVLKQFLIEPNGETKITAVIDDHAAYFQEKNVLPEYSVDGKNWEAIQGKPKCTGKDREHTLVYTFAGEEGKEQVYQFRITYKDRAGNQMILPKEHDLQVLEQEGGTYTSVQKIVIDHLGPRITALKFSEPIKLFGEEEAEQIQDASTKLYYDSEISIDFEIEDILFKKEEICVTIYERENEGSEWKEKEKLNEKSFKLPKADGEYYFTLSCQDLAGNPLCYGQKVEETKIGEAYAGGIDKDTGIYVSPVFVIDTQAPAYEISYNQTPEKYNSTDCIETFLKLSETNLDQSLTKVKIAAKDINQKGILVSELDAFSYDRDKGTYVADWKALQERMLKSSAVTDTADAQTLNFKLCTEANYTVFVEMVDRTGKKATYKKAYCIDRTPPSITVVTKDGQRFTDTVKVWCGLLDFAESDITYAVADNGIIDRIINKLTFGYFSKAKLLVQVQVHDEICGVEHLLPTCIDEGNEKSDYRLSKQMVVRNDKSVVKYEIELPINFKGTVQMHGIDHAENEAQDTGAIGMIVETEKQHEKLAKASLEVLTPYSKTPDYYAGDVMLRYFTEDLYSGLYQINYQAGTYAENKTYPAGEEICTENTKEYQIPAKENDTNHVPLGLEFWDNAGHAEKLSKEHTPTVHIDRTKPKIQIEFDNMEVQNEIYYRAERTATITIQERNFDPEDTRISITGPAAEISQWKHAGGVGCRGGNDPLNTKHQDQCRWTAKVYFTKDGDYTLTCDTRDLAGNQSAYGKTESFIIDQTLPEITVTYDNQDVKNACYYKAPRRAVIELKEHNFKPTDVKIKMIATNEGENLAVPVLSAWTSEEDVHRASIFYDYDAKFEFEISYTDLAGNEALKYEKDSFVIDLTAPELEIVDIADQSANKGVAAPRICFSDSNYDAKGTVLALSGYKNGTVKINGSWKQNVRGSEVKFKDFPYLPEQDDLYTLYAGVEDLAGNRSEKTIQFSVNRFGSVFTFDEETEALVGPKGTYYTKEAPVLTVYETNVDTLEFQELTLNLNGKLRTLVENTDFIVRESGNQGSWKQYTYEIPKENFLEEGIYRLTIYSQDRAKNLSDNGSKGKKIEFVVDQTAPSVVITGIENGKQYREASRECTIDAEDNVCIGSMDVICNGKTVSYNAVEVGKMNGRIKFTFDSANDWQKLSVITCDAAGNRTCSKEYRVLVTPNLLIQFYRNQTLFFTSMGSLMIFGTAALYQIRKKKSRNQEASS